MRNLVVFLLLVAAMVLAAGTSGDDEKKDKKAKAEVSQGEAAFSGSAATLYSAYEENEVAADAKYKGQILEISGTISNIGKDIMNEPYVALKTGHVLGEVQCMFSKSDSNQLASLRKGQKITVKGKCGGKMMNVILRNCVIN